MLYECLYSDRVIAVGMEKKKNNSVGGKKVNENY